MSSLCFYWCVSTKESQRSSTGLQIMASNQKNPFIFCPSAISRFRKPKGISEDQQYLCRLKFQFASACNPLKKKTSKKSHRHRQSGGSLGMTSAFVWHQEQKNGALWCQVNKTYIVVASVLLLWHFLILFLVFVITATAPGQVEWCCEIPHQSALRLQLQPLTSQSANSYTGHGCISEWCGYSQCYFM